MGGENLSVLLLITLNVLRTVPVIVLTLMTIHHDVFSLLEKML